MEIRIFAPVFKRDAKFKILKSFFQNRPVRPCPKFFHPIECTHGHLMSEHVRCYACPSRPLFLKELASEKCLRKKYDFRRRLREMRSLELEWSLRFPDLSDFKESVL